MFAQVANGGDLVSPILITVLRAPHSRLMTAKHSGIAQYYDLPILSLRNVFLHEALANVSVIRELFHQKSGVPADDLSDVDLRHVSERCCTPIHLSDSVAYYYMTGGGDSGGSL